MKASKLPFSYTKDRIVSDIINVAEKKLLDTYLEIDKVANSEKFQKSLELKFTNEEERKRSIDSIKESQFQETAKKLASKIASNAEVELEGEMQALGLGIVKEEFTTLMIKEILPTYKEISKKPVNQATIQYFRANVKAALKTITNSTIVPKNKP